MKGAWFILKGENNKNKKTFFLFSVITVLIFSITAYYGTSFQDMAPGSELEETEII